MTDFLTTLATGLELAIVLFPIAHAIIKAMPARHKTAPGQLELNFEASIAVEQPPVEEPSIPDPWEVVEVEPVATTIEPVAALHVQPTYLRLLPPAQMEKQPEQKPVKARKQAKKQPQVKKYAPAELRKLCQANSIKWRNAKGKNKHLSTAEMREQLTKLGAIAA